MLRFKGLVRRFGRAPVVVLICRRHVAAFSSSLEPEWNV